MSGLQMQAPHWLLTASGFNLKPYEAIYDLDNGIYWTTSSQRFPAWYVHVVNIVGSLVLWSKGGVLRSFCNVSCAMGYPLDIRLAPDFQKMLKMGMLWQASGDRWVNTPKFMGYMLASNTFRINLHFDFFFSINIIDVLSLLWIILLYCCSDNSKDSEKQIST